MAGILKFYPTCHHFQPSYKMTAFHHPWVQWPQGRNSLSFLPGPLVMATWPWSPLPQVFSTNPCARATLLGPHSLSSCWPKTISKGPQIQNKAPGNRAFQTATRVCQAAKGGQSLGRGKGGDTAHHAPSTTL